MKAKKASKKYKTPNLHAVILAVVIILMFNCLMKTEINQYREIAKERKEVSRLVTMGSLNLEKISEGYKKCSRDMSELEKVGKVGKFLVKCDDNILGRALNYIIVYGTTIMQLYLYLYIGFQFYLLFNCAVIYFKRRQRRMNSLNQ